MSLRAVALPVLLLAFATTGCGAADTPDDGPTTDDGPNAPVHGDDEVRALLRPRCATASCHGGGSDIGASLVLTGPDVPGAAAATFVNRPSREVPSMMLVVPGRPMDSYLMRKLDGTFGTLPACSAAPSTCGVSMPWTPATTDATLSEAQRDVVRRWILAGAPGQNGS